MRRFAEQMGDPRDIAAVIVVSDLGAHRSRGPLIVEWSNGTTRSGLALQRTITASLREEVDTVPDQEGTLAQFVRLAFPVSPGGQSIALDHGLDAVRVSGSGEVGVGGGEPGDVNVERYGALGRGVLRMIGTLDASEEEPERGEKSFVKVGGMILPAIVLKLLAVALILPALIASIDALARARRRREPVLPWAVWLAAAVLPFALALFVAWLMVVTGLIDERAAGAARPECGGVRHHGAERPDRDLVHGAARVDPRAHARRAQDGDATRRVGAGRGLRAFARAVGRSSSRSRSSTRSPRSCWCPRVHLWMLATLTDASTRASLVMAAIGLLPILAVAAYYMARFDLGPHACALVPAAARDRQPDRARHHRGGHRHARDHGIAGRDPRRARACRRRQRGAPAAIAAPRSRRQSIFGPGGHAGPGMLGGTGSETARR